MYVCTTHQYESVDSCLWSGLKFYAFVYLTAICLILSLLYVSIPTLCPFPTAYATDYNMYIEVHFKCM